MNGARRTRRIRRLVDDADGDDPLAGVANFFDLGIVFALGFLLALLSYLGLPALAPRADAVPLRHYRESAATQGGPGVRLGTAYRLESGDVVCVPDEGAIGPRIAGSRSR